MERLNLADYYDRLYSHDWYYYFSDDSRVYNKGESAEKVLESISNQSPEHKKLWDGFKKHMFSGKPWNTEQQPLPERPLEGA